jgi:O-antigen ligase
MYTSVVSKFADSTGRRAAITVGFTIPISVVLDNVLLSIMLVAWIISGRYSETLMIARKHPVCVGAIALFSILALGTLYGVQSPADARQYLSKYLDLAMVPVFLYYFRDPFARRDGLLVFAAAMALVLVYSFLIRFGVLELGYPIQGTRVSPVVFKFRVTHNFLMAFSAFLFTWLAITSPLRSEKRLFYALAVLAAFNVILMVEGATGYIILFALALLLVFSLLPRRLIVAAVVAIPLLVTLLAFVPGPFSSRLSTTINELQTWRPNTAMRHSSAGLRLEFYKNTLEIIADHPIAGVGTGGFTKAYEEKIQGTDQLATQNPHNEYLMIGVQTGIIGLIALLGLFATQFYVAKHLPTRLEMVLAHGLVISIAIGCLLNSLLLDHTEGLFYAWLTGLLYGGLRPAAESAMAANT